MASSKNKPYKAPRSITKLFPQVEWCVDSPKAARVTVEPRDCEDGQKLRSSECALARATRRQYHAQGAVIGMTFSYIVKGNKAVRFKTPVSVAREIVSFDRNKDFAPGEYHIGPISPSARLTRPKAKPKANGSNHGPRRVGLHRTVRVRSAV